MDLQVRILIGSTFGTAFDADSRERVGEITEDGQELVIAKVEKVV